MEQFLAFNLQGLLQTLSLLAGGFFALGVLRSEQRSQGLRLDKLDSEIAKLRDVLVQMARQEERMTAMDQRMLIQGRRIDRITDQLFRYGKTQEDENTP